MGYCIANLLCAFMGKSKWHSKNDQRLASTNRQNPLPIHLCSYNLSASKCPRCCSIFVAFSEDSSREVQLEDISLFALVVTSKCFIPINCQLMGILWMEGFTRMQVVIRVFGLTIQKNLLMSEVCSCHNREVPKT